MRAISNPKSNTVTQLKKIRAAIVRWNRVEARLKTIERKQDTRRKIQLGGLVKKAGLHDEPTAVLLGLMLEASEMLQSEEADIAKERWRLKGDIALIKTEEQ